MKRQPGLAAFAGHDPHEREMGFQRGPRSPKTLAIIGSKMAANRVQLMGLSAQMNPPSAAQGGFPYFANPPD